MPRVNAAEAGTIAIGGDLVVNRLGYGTMRLPGPGVIGPPANLGTARETLRLLPELGVNLIETSVAYGPLVADLLVREVLHPYRGMVIASSGGLLRPGPSQWSIDGRPEALRRTVEASLKVLGVERLDLWQLQRIDPKVPIDDQLGSIAEMQRIGLIRHVGLCNVTVAQIDAAFSHFTVACVQSRYHVIDRSEELVLERCERDGIPFLAYFPLATGALAAADSVLVRISAKLGITPGQVALAWLLRRSKVIVAIPGTSQPAHARENVAAASVRLSDQEFAEIERIGRRAAMLRAPKVVGAT